MLTALSFSLKATHIVGGELNYRLLNDSTYQLTLKVYRDCFLGIPLFDNPAYINVFDGNNAYIGRINVPRPPWDTLPVVLTDPCLVVPPNVCVEKINYNITVRLPVNETGYQLAYQRCCRNATILNMWDDKVNFPDSSGMTVNCFIPPVNKFRNSNPVFTNFPPVAICANKLLDFDHSATDLEGDSLVYKLCTPLDGLSSGTPTIVQLLEFPPYPNIRWRPPYSLQDMLSGSQALQIDSKTGRLTAVPGRIGQFVVGVCVEEYRNGQFISETRRDFQFNVADCAPVVRSFFRSPDTSCNNRTISFQNQSTGASFYVWDFGDGNTSSAINPTHTYSDYGVYDVRLIANPGSICADTFTKRIYITEDNLQVSVDDITVCSEADFLIQLKGENGTISKVIWIVNGDSIQRQGNSINLTLTESQVIQYVAFSSQGCSYTGSLNVNILATPKVNASALPDRILAGEEVILSTDIVEGYTYQWSPAIGVANFNQPITTARPLITTWFKVVVTDPETGCKAIDSVLVEVITCKDSLDVEIKVSSQTENCGNLEVKFEATSPVEGVVFRWYLNNQLLSEFSSLVYLFETPGTYNWTLIVSKENICMDTILFPFTASFDDLGYTAGDMLVCEWGDILIDLNITSEADYQVYWLNADVTSDTDTFRVNVSSDTVFYFNILFDNECFFTDTISIVRSAVDVQAIADKYVVKPGESVQLNAIPEMPYSYVWQPSNLLNNPNIINPTAIMKQTTTFTVFATNDAGCMDSSSVLIEVEAVLICDETTLFIPSAFSPNGDGKNDIWRIRGQSIEAVDIVVYNRWGQLVFETTNPQQGWDGRFEGQPAEGEVFGYYARVWCKGGEEIIRSGNVTILK